METIDVRPTWFSLVSDALRHLPHATPEGAEDMRALILHAARVADLHVAHVDAQQEQEPNAYTLCAACQGTAHDDEGYTIEGQAVCLGCYHEHSAGLNAFDLPLLRGE